MKIHFDDRVSDLLRDDESVTRIEVWRGREMRVFARDTDVDAIHQGRASATPPTSHEEAARRQTAALERQTELLATIAARIDKLEQRLSRHDKKIVGFQRSGT